MCKYLSWANIYFCTVLISSVKIVYLLQVRRSTVSFGKITVKTTTEWSTRPFLDDNVNAGTRTLRIYNRTRTCWRTMQTTVATRRTTRLRGATQPIKTRWRSTATFQSVTVPYWSCCFARNRTCLFWNSLTLTVSEIVRFEMFNMKS